MVIRGGYSKVFDRIGQGIALNFDQGAAFGMSTSISSPFGDAYETDPSVRFVDTKTMPPTMPTAPPGGFPQTPPIEAGIITSSIDDTLVTPSAHMANVVIGRDLGQNFAIEGGYIGRFGRDLLIRRDLAMALNLVDTRSGMDYFTAAQTLIRAIEASGIAPGFAGHRLLGTPQDSVLGEPVSRARPSRAHRPPRTSRAASTTTVRTTSRPSGGRISSALPDSASTVRLRTSTGSTDSLAALSSLGRSNYNAMFLTLRKRYSDGLQYDINYTLSKSEDMGSNVERGSAFGNFGAGGYSGFLINSFDPELNYGISDFDVRHQINVNWIWDLPFGQTRKFASGASGFVNQIIGDWSIAGLGRWTSGFPFSVQNCRSCWPTNWNLQGNASLVTPGQLPETELTKNAVDNRPSPFADPENALNFFRFSLPGEQGLRNAFRGDGYFNIDISVSKSFRLGIADNRLRFRWDVFNVTNTAKFDVGDTTMLPDRSGFGRYDATLATCDAQAGRCMQFALRYEF